MEATTKKVAATEQSNDYEFSAVPQDKRKSYFSLTIVWTGYVFVITSMMIGGGLAAGLNFLDIILVTILGNVFLGVIATLVRTYLKTKKCTKDCYVLY